MNSTTAHHSTDTGGILNGLDALHEPVSHFFVQAVIIICMTRVLSLVGYYLKQPTVVFEIIGGILLGPSAIGQDDVFARLVFPQGTAVMEGLSLVAQIGLVLYLFLVGLELDITALKANAYKAGIVSISGMIIPFGLGIAVSKHVYDEMIMTDEAINPKPKFVSFFVFMGTAMCITAFPVLARILKETGLIYTKPGSTALAAAAVGDCLAWCLLVLAVSLASGSDTSIAGYVFLCIMAFALGLFVIIAPIFAEIVKYAESFNSKAMDNNLFALLIVMIFASAYTTQVIGTDGIFGGFLMGLIVPRDSKLFHSSEMYLEMFVTTVTLPLYFTLSGLKTDLSTLSSGGDGGTLVLILFVATASKLIGAGAAAYFTGLNARDSLVVGVLMNTRGLVELIVLNLGLQTKILNIRVFTCMVIMALFTTFLTCPVVNFIYPTRLRVNMKDEEAYRAVNAEAAGADIPKVDTCYLNYAKICLMIDKLEGIPHLLELCSLFSSTPPISSTNITAIELVEPTFSDLDPVLGENEYGSLLQVDTEADILNNIYRADVSHRRASIVQQNDYFEYHCIAQFARITQCEKLSYARLLGAPDDFPREIVRLADADACNLSIFPWRNVSAFTEKLYFEKLVWDICRNSRTPVVLAVPFQGPIKNTTGAQRQIAVVKNVFVVLNLCNDEGSSVPDSVPLLIIPMVYKLAQKKQLTITVGIANDVQTRGSEELIAALDELIAKVAPPRSPSTAPGSNGHSHHNSSSPVPVLAAELPYANINIVYLPYGSSMYPELRSEIIRTYNPELVVCGFTDEASSVTLTPATPGGSSRARSNSISNMINVVVSQVNYEDEGRNSIELTSFRRSLSVSHSLIANTGNSSTHPELGFMGQALYSSTAENCQIEMRLASIMVVHAPIAVINQAPHPTSSDIPIAVSDVQMEKVDE